MVVTGSADVRFLERIVFSRRQIEGHVVRLAQQIDAAYGIAAIRDRAEDDDLLLLGILEAAMYFTCDLSRELSIPNHVAWVRYHSYAQNVQGAGQLYTPTVELDRLAELVEGHDVLLVDTICDTGETLDTVEHLISGYSPRSLSSCALLLRAGAGTAPTYAAVEVQPGQFFYGYGLDDNGGKRHLPFIAVTEE